jgi:hypothetical protein
VPVLTSFYKIKVAGTDSLPAGKTENASYLVIKK